MTDDKASIPGVPFDPKMVGPLDLLIGAGVRIHEWMVDNSTALIASLFGVVALQVLVYVQAGIVFLRIPTPPNWMLVMFLTLVFFAPLAAITGVLLGRGLYRDDTVLLSITSGSEGDQRLKHVSPDRFDNCRIINQNGESRGRSYLETVSVNGRQAYEVDSFDDEHDVLVASSMAGRTNQDIRSDRISIRKIKMEAEVDEATEMKANARDIIRERSSAVANWIIRTAQGATIPDGAHLYDEMQESLESVDPLSELDQSPIEDPEDDDQEDDDQEDDVELGGESTARLDIFTRAEKGAAGDSAGEASADD